MELVVVNCNNFTVNLKSFYFIVRSPSLYMCEMCVNIIS